MNRVHLEVIATTLSDVKAAQAGGADRIELITAGAEGGLTPSYALIEQAVQAAHIPVRVMIRPHARSFVYDKDDCMTIVRDIQMAKQAGAEAIVFGALTAEGKVDEHLLAEVLKQAEGMSITFHRAIDESIDLMEVLQVLKRHSSITDVLTSGGQPTAQDGAVQLQQLVNDAGPNGLRIVAGSGISSDNVQTVIRETGVPWVHAGSSVRHDGLMGNAVDAERVKQLRALLDEVSV
ncbi:copper homeostasis protein CutC [Paenibacillus sp. SC116]|uniref:copper homeostasis protein CutC n=1 Tax=Paenibacillus sp. SC116 TaxID=2968986 RepID=UPI00215B4911|nr:copper homeostasis protein CutC [Paenibacillus sp. SC116]MCR8846301.1 copper homeostasis protein CutC [Paenibacillus sp. SC116]